MESPGDAPNPIKDEQESPKRRKSVVVFVLGGPGSGKDTQCAKIVEHFGYTHLSANDLLRAEISSGSEHGAMIQSMISEESILPCEITVKLLCKAMEESENDKFLIDDFPLNEEDGIGFENAAGIEPAFVLFFDCPEDELERRILNRNQGREDDNIETIKKTLKDFVDSTLPIVSYYEPKGKLRKIDAAKPSEEVSEAVKLVFASETAKPSEEVSEAVKLVFASVTPQQSKKRRNLTGFSIPFDLSTEIFTRLPAKSAIRFQLMSKLWRSTIRSPSFTNQFLANSKDRPRLLFAVQRHNTWSFFSAPQSPNSPVVAADSHSKFSGDVSRFICGYASGLVYFPQMWISKEGRYSRPVICNPITGNYVSLPLPSYPDSRGVFGFDPIHKLFKVLADQRILKLDRFLSLGEKIDCPDPLSEGICIDGVIYYLAAGNVAGLPSVVVALDLKTEELECIPAGCFPKDVTKLINYKGTIAGIWWNYVRDDGGKIKLKLSLGIWKAMEKDWSIVSFRLSKDNIFDRCNFSIVGMTSRGELVLAMDYTGKAYHVIYLDLEKKTLKEVEVQGFGAKFEELHTRGRVHVFVDHVEDLDLDDANKLTLSIM